MSFYIIKIPGRTVIGEPSVLPTSYSDDYTPEEMHSVCRQWMSKPQNLSTRIDDKQSCYCWYVFVSAESEVEALAKVNSDPHTKELRGSAPVFYYQ